MLGEVATSIPPQIASRDYQPGPALVTACEAALVAIIAADTDATGRSAALARFMLRTESVASSKIERVNAGSEDYARALVGSRANSSATSMVAATEALHTLVERAGRGRVDLSDILAAHHDLMRDDPREAAYAGRPRDMQNWIGGSDHSPVDALFVPPPPDRVGELLDDLIAYVNRDDLPALVQASIAHAQFESIHPFTDGNGRIGRALIGAVLRRRGVTRNVVVPLASGILAVRDDYFGALTRYRAGHVEPLALIIARSAAVAAAQSREVFSRLAELPAQWRSAIGARTGSGAVKLLPFLFDNPVMTSDDAINELNGSAAAYRAIEKLEASGIVREITGRKRDRVWVATEVMGELDSMDARIARRMLS